jgi:hypothetical protein
MKPTRAEEVAVLRAVTYAALFDYPLTLAQLHASLPEVRAEAEAVASWWRESEFLQARVDHRDGLYFPAGRPDLLQTRARREALSRDLLERDRRILSFVAGMPFVRMVALSGSLAHLNAERTADLDLFVITAPGRVWSVTLAVLVIAKLLGWRQRLCLNYVVSEAALRIEPQDLFSANQIIHLRPIYGHEVFERFIDANAFVRQFYPNFSVSSQLSAPRSQPPVSSWWTSLRRVVEAGADRTVAPLGERAARAIYSWHLSRKATAWLSHDQVRLEEECLKLHTSSHRSATLAGFDRAMTRALEARRSA